MKNIQIYLIAIFSFLNVNYLLSQKDYMSIITDKSCECLSEIEETPDTEKFNMQLGLCIIEAASPYKKQLKADHNIDLDKIDTQGEKLGQLIGFRMASVCPDQILKASKGAFEDDEYDQEFYYTTGTIVKIEKEQFVVFSIKNDDDGKTSKYYWLGYVDSEIDLQIEYNNLTGKSIELYYRVDELFDARIDEYKSFNVIEEIELIK